MQYINPIWYMNTKNKWIINAGDSLKWGDFYCDFDTVIEKEEDYDKLRDDVRMALRYIKIIMGIDLNQVRFFFSGGKGIHITVPAITFGLEPHAALNQIYKHMAEEIATYCKNGTIDLKVYDDKRMFRMVNSWNYKGQAYKIPITYEEFNSLSHTELKRLAQQPREITVTDAIPSTRAVNGIKQIIKDWTEKAQRKKEFSGKIKELKVLPPCIEAMYNKVFRETVDERNNSATALASFYMQQGVEYEDCLSRVQKWNEEQCSPPQKKREVEMSVESIYNSQHKYGCATFKRVSGVCEKERCPLFNKELNKREKETEETANA